MVSYQFLLDIITKNVQRMVWNICMSLYVWIIVARMLNKQAVYGVKNYANPGECYPLR